MIGSNSSIHGHQHVEDDLPKTRAALGDMIEESIVAAMRRMSGGHLLSRVMGININTAPLPHWLPTTGNVKETTIARLVVEERQELLPMSP